MSDREKDAQPDQQMDEQTRSEVEDLDVKGGKVQMQDFHFTQRVNKSSP